MFSTGHIFDDLDKFSRLEPQMEHTNKKKKNNVYDTPSELYNDLVKNLL